MHLSHCVRDLGNSVGAPSARLTPATHCSPHDSSHSQVRVAPSLPPSVIPFSRGLQVALPPKASINPSPVTSASPNNTDTQHFLRSQAAQLHSGDMENVRHTKGPSSPRTWGRVSSMVSGLLSLNWGPPEGLSPLPASLVPLPPVQGDPGTCECKMEQCTLGTPGASPLHPGKWLGVQPL